MEIPSIEMVLNLFNQDMLLLGLRILLIALTGTLFVRIIAVIVRRTVTKNASEQSRVLVHKTIIYTGGVLVLILVMSEMGVRLSALLGAAGVLGVALGIASQKSIGNIISGFFLVSDKTFEVGDVVRIGTNTGVVYSLDLLSIKLRTFDNMFIRIPNDLIITTEIVNITRFPIRRMDFNLTVTYQSDLPRVRDILLDIADRNPLCLQEPAPLFLGKNFVQSGVEILFAVWFEKTRFVDVKNTVFLSIKERFDAEGIELPVMQIKLWNSDR
jgi:small-conductance mechanosensitive channel